MAAKARGQQIDEAWLRSLKPRQELVARYALRGLIRGSQRAAADRAFSNRIDELLAMLDLDEDGRAAVLREARALREKMAAEIDKTAKAERQPASRRTTRKRR